MSNLDPDLRQELRVVIRDLQHRVGITTLFVTHDQDEAAALGDRIALLLDGRLRQVGTPRALFEEPVDVEVARFFGGVNFLSGVKKGDMVFTAVGPIHIGRNMCPDGQVLLTIRPEAIEIGANGSNNVMSVVHSYSYQGRNSLLCAATNGVQLQVVASPFTSLGNDEQIMLHFPPERICVLPDEPRNGDIPNCV